MIKPLEDKLVVRPVKDSEKVTTSGLILTSGNDSAVETGEVLAVGNGITLQNGVQVPLNVNVGDTVMYVPYAGQEVEDGSEKVLILSYREILAVVEDDNE